MQLTGKAMKKNNQPTNQFYIILERQNQDKKSKREVTDF
jgi:hypothetical protein